MLVTFKKATLNGVLILVFFLSLHTLLLDQYQNMRKQHDFLSPLCCMMIQKGWDNYSFL